MTKTVVSARGTTETITNEYVYDADKEAVTGSKDGVSGNKLNSNIIYNNYCRNIGTASEPSLSGLAANSTEYDYDDFYDRVTNRDGGVVNQLLRPYHRPKKQFNVKQKT